ncbi:hypothetical protein [Spirillospora sp. NPDC048823]|uniref:hypothetical protein n=1 Tax=unclassified Spirillospora TaxID=2642701 RepID=UPI003710D65E
MNAAQYLAALASALTATGWSARLEDPEKLRILPPDLARRGQSIQVKAGVGGVPWFVTSTGDPLRPCHDLTGAVAAIGAQPVPHHTSQAWRRRRKRNGLPRGCFR